MISGRLHFREKIIFRNVSEIITICLSISQSHRKADTLPNGALSIPQSETSVFFKFSQLSCSQDLPSGLFINNAGLICTTLYFKGTTAAALLVSQAMPRHFLESFGDNFPFSAFLNSVHLAIRRKD